MAAAKVKEARMACSPSEEANFLDRLKPLRDYCTTTLANHLKKSPDVVWTSKDGQGDQPTTMEEEAKLKLVLDVEFDEKTSRPMFPPPNNRLSDELVYLVTKFVGSYERARLYPYDFDNMGNINPHRVSSGPAPIVWAHGLPFFPVYKGYYILCGRAHVQCIGWLLREKTRDTMQANPIWSIGAVIAPDSAVTLPHTITRQMTLHKPHGTEKDASYRGKALTRDVVAHEHHLCAVVPSPNTNNIEVCPLWNAWGYNVRCGPMRDGVKPTVMPKEFFAEHGIKYINYAFLDRPYVNQMLEDEDSDEKADPDSGIEVEDAAEMSGEAAGSNNQVIMAQSVPSSDVDMDTECPVKVPAEAHEQTPEQALPKGTEVAMETVMETVGPDPIEQATEEVARKVKIAAPIFEKDQLVVSNNTVETELDLAMDTGDRTKESIDKPNPEQTSTSFISFTDTTIQASATDQHTKVKLMNMQPELKHAAIDASADQTHTSEQLTVAQNVSTQSSAEQLSNAAACGLMEELKAIQEHTSQALADEAKVDTNTGIDRS